MLIEAFIYEFNMDFFCYHLMLPTTLGIGGTGLTQNRFSCQSSGSVEERQVSVSNLEGQPQIEQGGLLPAVSLHCQPVETQELGMSGFPGARQECLCKIQKGQRCQTRPGLKRVWSARSSQLAFMRESGTGRNVLINQSLHSYVLKSLYTVTELFVSLKSSSMYVRYLKFF